MLKNKNLVVLAASIFVIAFWYYWNNEKAPITIGYIGSLTGRLSAMGISGRNGIQIAIDHINQNGGVNGRDVKLLSVDHFNDPSTVEAAIKNFEADGIDIIIGPLISKMALPVIASTKGKKMLVISPTASTDSLANIDDHFFRTTALASNQGAGLAKYMVKQGVKRVAIIYDINNVVYTESVFEKFQQLFLSDERKIVYTDQLKEKSPQRFVSIAKEIKEVQADSVLFIASGIDSAQIAQQIRKLNYQAPFFGSSWVKTNDFTQHGGRATEGAVLISIFESEEKSKRYQRFSKDYQSKFRLKPSFIPAYAYDAATVALVALAETKYGSIQKIKDWIIAQKTFEGLESDIVINKFGDAERPHTLFKIVNGEYQIIHQ